MGLRKLVDYDALGDLELKTYRAPQLLLEDLASHNSDFLFAQVTIIRQICVCARFLLRRNR